MIAENQVFMDLQVIQVKQACQGYPDSKATLDSQDKSVLEVCLEFEVTRVNLDYLGYPAHRVPKDKMGYRVCQDDKVTKETLALACLDSVVRLVSLVKREIVVWTADLADLDRKVKWVYLVFEAIKEKQFVTIIVL